MAEIIKPIYEAQVMSENDSSTLAHVVPWWLQLEQDLKHLSEIYLYLKPILAPGRVLAGFLIHS
jgi:hypothetical protein